MVLQTQIVTNVLANNKSLFNHIILLILFSTPFISSCNKSKIEKIEAVVNRDSIAGLTATKITTVISDSGITRYRIYTDLWNIFDKAEEPYWEFPVGLHFERFDETLHIDANFHSNYAKYFDKKELWVFRNKVKAINIEGKMFETEHLFWNQLTKKIYSDTIVKITTPTKIVFINDFVANETLTEYHGKDGSAIMAFEKEDADTAKTTKKK
ncbi:MAG: LPS export ABC transporter periplasmic protein LptC, partial [Paludibacter sp.]